MEGSQPRKGGPPDEDAIYRAVGLFVIVFQVLQSKLFQLASFALDPEHAGFQARRTLADLWFGGLVDRTATSVSDFLDQRGRDEPEFRAHLEALLVRCRELAHYRNKVVHSAYVFLEGGGELLAILRSDMSKGAEPDEVELEQEWLHEDSFKEAMNEIAEVAFGLGQCHIQLIAWTGSAPSPSQPA
jgi:hypothetical protein